MVIQVLWSSPVSGGGFVGGDGAGGVWRWFWWWAVGGGGGRLRVT